ELGFELQGLGAHGILINGFPGGPLNPALLILETRPACRQPMKSLGCLALVCYAVHAGFHLYHGRPEDLLWACHIGAAVVGLGLILSSATLNGVGVLLLCMGTPLWLLDLAGGGEFYPTSCFTHLGGLAIGIYGLHRLGMARGTWWKASITLVAL